MGTSLEDNWSKEKKRLGKGGQGFAYIVYSKKNPSEKAVGKELRNNKSPQARERMDLEVASLKLLKNAGGNVPSVLDGNTSDYNEMSNKLYFVMEFIEGPTLKEMISKKGYLNLDQALLFTQNLCKTIRIAHEQDILHRDLKPENIIVRDEDKGDLVIIDFGLTFNLHRKDVTEVDETFRNAFLDLPETNTPDGNLDRKDRRDKRSDITALCAILYFCLTGIKPGQLIDGKGLLPHQRPNGKLINQTEDIRFESLNNFFTQGFATHIDNRFQSAQDISLSLIKLSTQNSELEISNPIKMAESLTMKLKTLDRKTILNNYKADMPILFEHIESEIKKYKDKLGNFEILHSQGREQEIKFSDEYGLISYAPFTIQLKIKPHRFEYHRLYAVGEINSQIHLLSADYRKDLDARPQIFKVRGYRTRILPVHYDYHWEKIAVFTETPKSIFERVSANFEEWLTFSMQKISEELNLS